MFKKPHLIVGKDLEDQLFQTIKLFDSESLLSYIKNKKILMNPRIEMILNLNEGKNFSWESFVNENNYPTFDSDGLDLMKKMFHLNPEERISVNECLDHPFLKE